MPRRRKRTIRRIPKKKVTTQTAAENLAKVLQPAQTASTGFVRRPVEPVEPVAPAQPSFERRPVEPIVEPTVSPSFVRRQIPPRAITPPPPLSQPAQTMLQQTALSLGLNTFGQGPQQDYDVQAIQGTPETPSISVYRGPTGSVGPNEFVVTELADVALIERTSPGTNIFYANPRTGELEAKAGIMAFVPALMQYLDGGDMPDSVVQTLIDLGLLDDSGVVTTVGESLTSGAPGGGVFKRTPFLTGSPGRFGGTRGASLGLVNWRI